MFDFLRNTMSAQGIKEETHVAMLVHTDTFILKPPVFYRTLHKWQFCPIFIVTKYLKRDTSMQI